MDMTSFIVLPDEQPLDRIPADGGFCGIFRHIACIGDSLSSGEFESNDGVNPTGYHDMYDYSWGQYLARMAGCQVYNFSCGGMNTQWYWNTWAEEHGCWDTDKLCEAYIIALGVNDRNISLTPGTLDDICDEDYNKNADTFIGYYARIIQRIKSMQPRARFFLMTMPANESYDEQDPYVDAIRAMAEYFDNAYLLDLHRYGPLQNADYRRRFYLGGHLNAAGYILTAKMTAAYIDYIIRKNPEEFAQVSYIGTDLFHVSASKY